MKAEQYEGLLAALGDIADRLPAPAPAPRFPPAGPPASYRKSGAREALVTMLGVAEGWARTASENEEAMSGSITKSEDQPFYLADIRRMINDAAAESGVAPVWKD